MFEVSLGGSLHSRFVDLERDDLAVLLAALSWHYAEYHSGRSVANCQKQMEETA